jgi:UDP-glucuronate decarboxylase
MKKILITGGSGFIGSHLCKILLAQGNQIYCLDNLSCGNKDNIATLLGHPRFSFIEHDVKDKIFINVDEIYNLACPASPKQYQINPVDTVLTCVLGAFNMLNLAQQ